MNEDNDDNDVQEFGTVRAESVVAKRIVIASGDTPRITLQESDDGHAQAFFYDLQGRRRAAFGVGSNGEIKGQIWGRNGAPRMLLGLDAMPKLGLYDSDGVVKVMALINRHGTPILLGGHGDKNQEWLLSPDGFVTEGDLERIAEELK